jgi:hypothetical protein
VKTSIRWWSRFALVAGMGLTTLIACSSDRKDGKGEEQRAGTLALALQTTAPSGSTYRLRNAFFQITNIRSGETVRFLSSEDGLPEAAELTAIIDSGSYTVTLQPGWFLERTSVGTPGGGTAGSTTGGSGPIPVVPKASKAKPVPEPEAGGASDGGSSGGSGPIPGAGGAFPSEGGEGPITAGAPPTGGTFTTGGTVSTGGSPPTGGTFVEAQLISDAVQFFFLAGGDETFVGYQFKVGGEIIDFNKGKVHIGISVDDSEACQVPPDVTKVERVLMETNVDAVGGVSLTSVFDALATNGGHQGDGQLIYQQIFDSYASADQAQLPGGVHCGDETTNGVPTLNGFPIDCNRLEARHVNDMQNFFATAFVNRIDLAPANGAHCGQQRMIFANNSFNRAFIIVEAQIPNPSPELGINGCLPLAQFWFDQNNDPDAKSRGQRLAQAFLQGGVPGLAEFGFGPFYTAENLTVGSGQIRTNQFDSFPWTLREFKLALDGDSISAVPFPTAESPAGALWNENSGLPQGEACRENFLSALDGVLTDDMSRMSFVIDGACKDAESRNDFSEDYASNMSPGFSQLIQDKLSSIGSPLSAFDVANRARFSGSCIGCHNESSGSFLGNGVFAPKSPDFPQVFEFTQECGNGETGNCFATSPALNTVFLPGRLAVLSNLLGVPVVPNPCTGGGGGGTGGSSNGGFGGSVGTAGKSSGTAGTAVAGSFGMGDPGMGTGGKAGLPFPETSGEPAPVVVIDLPSVDQPVEELQEEEAEIRDEYGDVTISGKSAKSTH